MIIADTGFFLALLNRDDKYHSLAKRYFKALDEPLITTWPVLVEASHILLKRKGSFVVNQFLAQILGGSCDLFDIPKELQRKIVPLMTKYRELPMDLADASLILLAEYLGHGRIVSTDERDFKTYRWKNRNPFRNLLLEVDTAGK